MTIVHDMLQGIIPAPRGRRWPKAGRGGKSADNNSFPYLTLPPSISLVGSKEGGDTIFLCGLQSFQVGVVLIFRHQVLQFGNV
jgi:hypothetical protein